MSVTGTHHIPCTMHMDITCLARARIGVLPWCYYWWLAAHPSLMAAFVPA